jgi:molybdopterin converting factor small subunit
MRLAGLPDEEVFLAIVNGKRATPDRILAPGDMVTFVPPVAGG